MYNFYDNYEAMFENIVGSAYTYLSTANVKTVIVGMSGGIDSALTAALAKRSTELLFPDRKILVEGIIIDIESKKEEVSRGTRAADALCHSHRNINMEDSLDTLIKNIGIDRSIDDLKTRIRIGNLKARLRMQYLYDLAKEKDGIVLSTDNYTEYLLGFWTLHGDVGDFGMIQNLWKTEVYGLAEYIVGFFYRNNRWAEGDALQEAIEAMPTDGLGVTDTDFDQIYPEASKNHRSVDVYHKVDILLYDHIFNRFSDKNEVVLRHKNTKFKRENPFNIPRKYIIG